MNHICIRGLVYLSKRGGLLYGEKFRFFERYAHEKKHASVTFTDSALLCPSKHVIEDKYSGVKLEMS